MANTLLPVPQQAVSAIALRISSRLIASEHELVIISPYLKFNDRIKDAPLRTWMGWS